MATFAINNQAETPHQVLSSYLVVPARATRRRRRRLLLRTQVAGMAQNRSKLLRRALAVFGLWGILSGAFSYAITPGNISSSAFLADKAALVQGNPTTSGAFKPGAPPQGLPGGPKGYALPPGMLAPDYTFANSYTKGQCTWYVAGRRQIPGNWDHARTWYYHAVASGWKAGTTPAIAAVAWTATGTFGHVALVEKISPDGKLVYISEMNYRQAWAKTYRWVPATSFKYIY